MKYKKKVHDPIRDALRDACANAGVNSTTEQPGIINGTAEKPGDVVLHNPGEFYQGVKKLGGDITSANHDIAVDVTVVDALSHHGRHSAAEMDKRAASPLHIITIAEFNKRNARPVGGGRTMEHRLASVNHKFWPMGFTSSGASGPTFRTFLKNLSKTANVRRGKDEGWFYRYWTTKIAMTLHKRSAQAALWRSLDLKNHYDTSNNPYVEQETATHHSR